MVVSTMLGAGAIYLFGDNMPRVKKSVPFKMPTHLHEQAAARAKTTADLVARDSKVSELSDDSTQSEINSGSILYPFQKSKDYVNISSWPGVQINLKYSTTDNFLKKDLYGDFNEAWLHIDAGVKLKKAIKILQQKCNQCQFVIFDAIRPRTIQKEMWDYVVFIKKTLYVANPTKGSVHNFGMAIDLSILDAKGKELDMGTPYDSFKPLAQPKYENEFLKKGELTQTQVNHRLQLRSVMEGAGFYHIYSEWWHFNALPGKWVRENYSIVE